MQLSELKPGTKVRVTYEGVVAPTVATVLGKPALCVVSSGVTHYYSPDGEAGLMVELIEPDYEMGAVYQDAEGDVYVYDLEGSGHKVWYTAGIGCSIPFAQPVRPLTRLVPEASGG